MIKEEYKDLGCLAPDWEPPPRLMVEAPTLEDLLRGFSCQPWLVEEYKGMAAIKSPSFTARAVGLVARLAMPVTREEVKALLKKLSTPNPANQTTPAKEWAKGLSQEVLEEIRRQTCIDAEDLAESLSTIKAGDADLAARVEMAAVLRDNVECMRWVLEQASALGELCQPDFFRTIDQEAIEHLTRLGWNVSSALPEEDDTGEVSSDDETAKIVSVPWHPRLGAVGAQEPLQWWGQLAFQPLPAGIKPMSDK